MRALLATSTPPHAELGEAPDVATCGPGEALVAVKAFSLNRGEVSQLVDKPEGFVAGWDIAGVVESAPADSGLEPGQRVVGLVRSGAWAEKVAVPLTTLAPLPDAVTDAQAATLPVAGLTALLALSHGGLLIGRRVAITGASGGVGRFAIQLAAQSGAEVTAIARRQEGLAELGAHHVTRALEPEGESFDHIIDAVGGPVLGAALQRITGGGTVVSFAQTVQEPVSFPTRRLFGRAPGASLYGMLVFIELVRRGDSGSTDLALLAGLVAEGRLKVDIDLETSWSEAPRALKALLDGDVRGKAVLHVD